MDSTAGAPNSDRRNRLAPLHQQPSGEPQQEPPGLNRQRAHAQGQLFPGEVEGEQQAGVDQPDQKHRQTAEKGGGGSSLNAQPGDEPQVQQDVGYRPHQ